MNIEPSLTPIEKAVLILHGQTALAKAINADHPNVKQQHVWKWLKAKRVPLVYAPAIERATGGRVTRYELRPDFFGPAPYRQTIHSKTKDIPPCLATQQSYATPP